MNTTLFFIDCKTNMHVGSGKANYGVIDQLVQRDATSLAPVIHASSLKGGIKEYCHHKNFSKMIEVFGSDKNLNGKTNHNTSKVGAYKFFDARLLTIPVRCDKRAYIHITCPMILEELCEVLPEESDIHKQTEEISKIFEGSNNTAFCFTQGLDNAVIEDFDVNAHFSSEKQSLLTEKLKNLFFHDIVMVRDEIFTRLTNDLHLPVMARNYLENGESKNLWYEQVVPRLTRFWGRCLHPDNEDLLFTPKLFKKEAMVQIGANGSVGYGYCTFSKIQEL